MPTLTRLESTLAHLQTTRRDFEAEERLRLCEEPHKPGCSFHRSGTVSLCSCGLHKRLRAVGWLGGSR